MANQADDKPRGAETYELRLSSNDRGRAHEFAVRFDDLEEVATTLAEPLLRLMSDELEAREESYSNAEDDQAAQDVGWHTIDELRPLLERRRCARLRSFRPPIDLIPVRDLYLLAAAIDDVRIEDLDDPQEELGSLVLLLASAQYGKNVSDLAAYTELPEDQVATYAERLWANGIWQAGRPYWPNLGQPAVLLIDALVAEGSAVAVAGTDGWAAAASPCMTE